MSTQTDNSEIMAVLASDVKKLVKHFKLDRRKLGDEGADSESAPEADNAMLENIGLAISELSARRTFTEEQKELMLRMFNASTNFLHKGQIDHQAELKSLLEIITRKLDEQPTEPQKTTIRREHHFSVDFKNSKAALTMIVMVLVILISLGFNTHQAKRNNALRNNDVKYRYVKMQGKASAEELYRLESIFTFDRNRDSIRIVRKQVERYEHLLKEYNENQHRTRLYEARSCEIEQDAQTVKEKR